MILRLETQGKAALILIEVEAGAEVEAYPGEIAIKNKKIIKAALFRRMRNFQGMLMEGVTQIKLNKSQS